jgi:hypothetical protein
MELRTDFSAIEIDRTGNPVYHNGELIYYSPDGDTTKLSVKVRARGNFRLNPENCDFPPLLLNFNISEVKNTLFDNQDRLKLVTPCQSEEDLLEEYLIYKLYNQITDLSMKARLVKILYYDTRIDKRVFDKFSYFIEEKDHIAERNNAFEKDKLMTPFDLNGENVKRMTVFQYIIGNKDWFITTRHNIIILQPNDTSLAPYAVPYDFDFSGFVNASYTKPRDVPEELLEKRRKYKGICYTVDEFNDVFDYFRELRPVFESIINNMKLISRNSRRQDIKYLEDFYKVTENNELIKQEFLNVCNTKKDYGITDN